MKFTKEVEFEYKGQLFTDPQADGSTVIRGTLVSCNEDGHQVGNIQAKVVRPAGNNTADEAYFLEHLDEEGFTAVVEE